jgi:outer membrane receptor protein involved in Fe transport
MANIRLSRYLNFFTNCHFEDGFPRQVGDPRDDISGYAIVDATLIARKFLKGYEGLELRGSAYNLFDKDYKHPQEPRLPNDLPMPGINYLLEIKYEF